MQCSRGGFASRRCLRLEWIDRYGDRDGDGFVEYSRHADHGLANQSQKDRATPSASSTAGLPSPDRPGRGAGLRVRRQAGLAELRERSGGILRSRSASTARRTSSRGDSTRPSGSRSGAASTRSPSTARSDRWTHAARTWDTCSGAASRFPSESDRRSISLPRRVGPAGGSHHGERRGGVQPDQLPQRDGLAARLGARCLGPGSSRLRGRGSPHRAGPHRGRGTFRLVASEVFAGYARDETRSRSHTLRLRARRPGRRARRSSWSAFFSESSPIALRQRLISTVTDEPRAGSTARIEGVRAYGRTRTVAVERGHVTIAEGV